MKKSKNQKQIMQLFMSQYKTVVDVFVINQAVAAKFEERGF